MKAILSQLEEIRADIGSFVLNVLNYPRHSPLTNHFPSSVIMPPFMYGAILLIITYYSKYGHDAVDKLYEDRLFPEYFRDSLAVISGSTKMPENLGGSSIWPDDWIQLPVTFAFPFGCIKDIEPFLMRTETIPKEELAVHLKDMANNRNVSKRDLERFIDQGYYLYDRDTNEGSALLDPAAIKTSSRSNESAQRDIDSEFYENYLQACAKDLESRIQPLEKDADTTNKEQLQIRKGKFAELLRLYPWFPSFYQEMSIIDDRLGDREAAKQNIESALLLEPENQMAWQSMEVICSKYSTQDDAVFARVFIQVLAASVNGRSQEYQIDPRAEDI